VTTVITELSTTLVSTARVRNPRPIQCFVDVLRLEITPTEEAASELDCGISPEGVPGMAANYSNGFADGVPADKPLGPLLQP
jgi:hypothetical protein